jgi:hypothetical protein
MMSKFQFSNVVVVDDDQVGVIVKTWGGDGGYNYDVYVRGYNGVKNYQEKEIQHFVYSKHLSPDEYEFYS